MKILINILYGFFTLLLIGIAGLFLVSLIKIPGNIETKIVKSGSMEPAIKTGAIVAIKPQAEYHIGDVVTFGKDTKTQIPTTHRLVKTRTENGVQYFNTKGDANEEADPNEIRKDEIIGKVVFNLPYAGYILDFAKKPLGFTLLIVIPAAMIVLDECVTIIREVVKLRRGKARQQAPTQPEPPIRPRIRI